MSPREYAFTPQEPILVNPDRQPGGASTQLDDDLVDGCARALWVMAWADFQEETDQLPHGGGYDLMDLAPPTPEEAYGLARALLHMIAASSHMSVPLFNDRARAIVDRDDRDIEDLGHYLALEAAGTGAAYSDDGANHGFSIPNVEVMSTDGDDIWGSGFSR